MARKDITTISPEAVERLRVLAVSVIALERYLLSLGATKESIREATIEGITNILNMTEEQKAHFNEEE